MNIPVHRVHWQTSEKADSGIHDAVYHNMQQPTWLTAALVPLIRINKNLIMTIKRSKLAEGLSVPIAEPRPCIRRIRGYLRAAQPKPRVLGTLLKIRTRPAALGSPASSPFLQKITVYWLNSSALSAMEGEGAELSQVRWSTGSGDWQKKVPVP